MLTSISSTRSILFKKIHEIGHGPKLIDYATQKCGKTLPYQQAYILEYLLS